MLWPPYSVPKHQHFHKTVQGIICKERLPESTPRRCTLLQSEVDLKHKKLGRIDTGTIQTLL